MIRALAIVALIAFAAPAWAETDAQFDARLMSQAHRRNMLKWYGYEPPQPHRTLRWRTCRTTPWERTCWTKVRY